MKNKPYKYKIGEVVLIRLGRITKRGRIKNGDYKKVTILGKTSAGGVKCYRTSGGGFKKEDEIFPI